MYLNRIYSCGFVPQDLGLGELFVYEYHQLSWWFQRAFRVKQKKEISFDIIELGLTNQT
ncbi:hypothetical protein [Tissierella praeacuta]|uniref:hypothetical protein n=1 Tax=Tissierella praeacuta TaxID=43131 RepID=UPI0028AB1059|nr:hypothetical protein [Tissierella praeacuta]